MLTIATATPLDCPPVGALTRLHVAKKRTTASKCARRRAHVRYERAVSRGRANAGWLGVSSDDISRRTAAPKLGSPTSDDVWVSPSDSPSVYPGSSRSHSIRD